MAYGFNEDKSKYEIKNGVVLWENPSPTADFAAQTVTLSDMHTNYDYIEIIVLYSSSTPRSYASTKFPTSVAGTEKLLQVTYNQQSSGQLFFGGRTATLAANNDTAKQSITFSNGYRKSTSGSSVGTTASAGNCIPVAVIGYKY